MDKHACASFNAHHQNSVGFVVVVEWRVCSMFGCCSRNPVRLRCCSSSQYLCPSLFTVNKLLTLFFWWQYHLGFSRIAFWAQAFFFISCFFSQKLPGRIARRSLPEFLQVLKSGDCRLGEPGVPFNNKLVEGGVYML
jgi:hypothetical protein